MKWTLSAAIYLLAALLLTNLQPASAGPIQPRRLALVIGNVDYVSHPVLSNVEQDVASIWQQLTEMHFEVVVAPPQRASMEDFTALDLEPFAAQIKPGDIVVFYYSGHGFSYGADNYMVPIGVPDQVPQSEVQFTFPAESSIRSFLQARHPAFLLMLMDACRSRPGFVQDGVSSGTEKGYAMPQRPPEDVSITSAVAPGFAASAGAAGMNSVFTEALVANIAVPGRELSVLQGKIAYQMRLAGSQDPWVAENRVTRLWLQSSPEVEEEARITWEQARASGQREKVAEYLAWYATGPYAADARKWLTDNQSATIAKRVAVAPVNVEMAWLEASANNTDATAIAYDGLQVSRLQSLGTSVADLSQLRRELAADPLSRNESALATKSLANGSIKKGTLIDLSADTDRPSPSPYYSALLAPVKRLVRLGMPKVEKFLAPDPQGSGATVEPEEVASILSAARVGGQEISWVSLSTAQGLRSKTVPSGLMAIQAAAIIAKSGVPAGQITTVEGVPETFDGVRVRIFTR